MEEVVSVIRNQYRKLHTTRSWDFIGLPLTAKRKQKSESDIIVALLDTGVTPQLQSFKDDGFGPPPAKWKGSCDKYANFSGCNNKLIGARYFKIGGRPDPSDILSPIDVVGHGTHTASTAAGNLVPDAMAASGVDRDFRSTIQLGNGKNFSTSAMMHVCSSAFKGGGLSTFNPKQKQYPLVNGTDAARNTGSKENARFCYEDSLDPHKVKGKLVYCSLSGWGSEAVVKGIGGIGSIMESDDVFEIAQIFMAPATIVNSSIGQIITNYTQSTRSPSAVIYKTHEVKIPAPFTASFSSRGPNPASNHILKPDVTAPGLNILASYTPMQSISGEKGDTQFSEFTLMSGTSMSCPHVSGVAAYVKSFHPDWSPAAIRSAIITTAVEPQSHIISCRFLCHEGYNGSTLSVLVGSRVNCTSLLPGVGHDAINYPTMQLRVKNNSGTTVAVFRRRVTNVGPSPTIFNATIKSPKGVEITVKPTSLIFSHTLQKKSFKVVVKAKSMASMKILSVAIIKLVAFIACVLKHMALLVLNVDILIMSRQASNENLSYDLIEASV
ncbi:unnamed protein product [Sphenostylis stenocarpa]|uniref:Uncharacterized protein n=1 Tax=Sphenostylis stenocarpa TaxID=92480 RepID=A0AA86ST95_9FABA|nr:unnamed protein product [Sphenostylis stenocarpa]